MKSDLTSKTIQRVGTNLVAWYRVNQRALPWRETSNPYHIWVSEVMLQQTQVNTVIGYYRNFLDQFPTVETLAAAKQQAVLKCWEGLGYYARARNLHRAARIVTDEHRGRVPDDYAAFRQLPGVGDYIAAAVLSIAFNQPFAVVDGNVKRVLARLMCIDTQVNTSGAKQVFQSLATTMLATHPPETFNQAVMELGALVCKPNAPDCAACPLSADCQAFLSNTTDIYPLRKRTTPTPTRRIAVGVVCRDGKLLITRRAADGLLGGLWEFPGGKIKSGEKTANACTREIYEETGLVVEAYKLLTHVKHAYTHFKISMDVFVCRYVSGSVTLNGPVDHRWITIGEIEQYPFPKANHKFIPILKNHFTREPSNP